MFADSLTPIPLSDYEIEQYFPREHFDESPEEVERLRQRYGYVRMCLKHHPVGHRDLQHRLNQTRVGMAYNPYLTQSTKLVLVTAAFGSLVGLAPTFVLIRAGMLVNAPNLVSLDVATGYVALFAPYKVSILGMVLVTLVGGLATAGTYYAWYYLPKSRAEIRGHSIDILFLYAIVYTYTLSHGRMSFFKIIRPAANALDCGEVSHEFEMIARSMDLFGNDLPMALHSSRSLAPSINFEQFPDDLLSVLDSSDDVTVFFDREPAMYLERARDEQEDFIETLSMLPEMFVATLAVAPLLLIITLMVINFLGGDVLAQLYALNYLIFPLGMGLFLLPVGVFSSPYTQDTVRTEHNVTILEESRTIAADFLGAMRREVQCAREAHRGGGGVASDGGFVDERLDDYRRENAVHELRTLVGDPLDIMRRQPYLSAVAVVPLASLLVTGVLMLGLATPALDAMFVNPYNTTVWFVVLPFAIVAVPLMVLHELRTRRRRTLKRRSPDTLNLLSSASQMDILLVESLALVSRWSIGALMDELRTLHNDIHWNHDAYAALMTFATRLDILQLPWVIRLIASGGRTSDDLSHALSVAAEDTRNYYKLEKPRRRAMGSCIAIVIIGCFVYLFVVLMIGASYLGPLAEMSVPTAASNGRSLPIGVPSVPLMNFHVVSFRSVSAQAVGSGFLAGKPVNNSVLSGLKYALRLSALALVASALA